MAKRRTEQRRNIWVVLGVALGAVVLFGVAWLAASYEEGGTDLSALPTPTIEGEPVPAQPQEGNPTAPVATGPALLGEGEVTVPAQGEPTIVVFLAHWCSVCQSEVPVITEWVGDGGLPEGVALRAVATSNEPTRPNYPPDEWLEREAWPAPVMYDDGSVAQAYGVEAFPFFAFVDEDGELLGRTSGALTAEQLTAVAQRLAEGAP